MLLLRTATGGNTDSSAVNFTLFSPGEAMNITYSNTVKSSSSVSEVSETEYHSSTLTATRKLTANSRKKKTEKTNKKSSVNYLLQLAEGKGYYLYCQQHIMKPQVSKTWPEQQNILWITATGDTLPYACNELEDKKFVPHWNFHFSRFNPPACEARNKLYTTYQWRVGMETISWALSRAKQTISCIVRSYWRK